LHPRNDSPPLPSLQEAASWGKPVGPQAIGSIRTGHEARVRSLETFTLSSEKYDYAPDASPVALGNYQRMLSLPLHLRLSDDDLANVVEAVLDVASRLRR
jgi:dTDP-4-amino-4,6-dideoxygalactose transaminase